MLLTSHELEYMSEEDFETLLSTIEREDLLEGANLATTLHAMFVRMKKLQWRIEKLEKGVHHG